MSARPLPAVRRDLLPISVASGFDRGTTGDLVAGLLLNTPATASVFCDPFTAELGYVVAHLADSSGWSESRTIELAHGCLSCALREATVAAVTEFADSGRYQHAVVRLHPGIEPDAATEALWAQLRGIARIDNCLTVLDESRWLATLAGDRTTADLHIQVAPDDARSAATVLAAGIESADLIVLTPSAVAVEHDPDADAALELLAPAATVLRPATVLDIDPTEVIGRPRFQISRLDPLLDYGLRDPACTLRAGHELSLVRWHARRPLHPQRLHDALDLLADGVLRSTGRLWLATRPDLVVGWQSAGDALGLGPEGRWPSADRESRLAFLGDGLDAERMIAILDSCLLTNAELAGGPSAALPDPFPDWSAYLNERGVA